MGELVPFSSGPRLKFAKPERIEVKGASWESLKSKVYKADGWKCRACGRRNNLTCHHMVHRSKQRLDVFENLLTLCSYCNDLEKDKILNVEWINRDLRIIRTFWRKTTAETWQEGEPGIAPSWFHNGQHPLPQIAAPRRTRPPVVSRQHVTFRDHLESKGQFFNRQEEWNANKERIVNELKAGKGVGQEDAVLLVEIIRSLEKRTLI